MRNENYDRNYAGFCSEEINGDGKVRKTRIIRNPRLQWHGDVSNSSIFRCCGFKITILCSARHPGIELIINQFPEYGKT